jgi:uncharacterized membrane protein YedE/YeeE
MRNQRSGKAGTPAGAGEKLAGIGFGAAFGFILGWAQLTDYDVIHNMLLLREADVFLIMASAIMTAAIGVRVLRALGLRSLLAGGPVAWTVARPAREHVVGSILFGIGWALACTCPGPVAAQLGRGQWAAVFTAAGLLGGIALRRRFEVRARPGPQSSQPEPQRQLGACAGL